MWTNIWDIHFTENLGHPFGWDKSCHVSTSCNSTRGHPFGGNQIARVAMFLCHARSHLLVVQEKLKTFNVGQAFWASISLGIWGIHLAGNQIARVAMFLTSCNSTRGHPFGQEPDCESCHVSMPHKVTFY